MFSEGPWHAGRSAKCSEYGSSLIHLCERKHYNPTYSLLSKVSPKRARDERRSLTYTVLRTFPCEQCNPYSNATHRDTAVVFLTLFFLRHNLAMHSRLASNLQPQHPSSGITGVSYHTRSWVYLEGRKMRLKDRINNQSKDPSVPLKPLSEPYATGPQKQTDSPTPPSPKLV